LNKKLLIIGHTFPEPSTTAAGVRMMQLIALFREYGFEIHFATAAERTAHSTSLENKGISYHSIQLNDSSFDAFVSELNPDIVLFDRFTSEEQFGWRVTENCPNALRILDTEDLHFLRKAREEAFKKNTEINLYSEVAKREIASIYRSDLSLIISQAEMELLTQTFQVTKQLLHYLPLFAEKTTDTLPRFEVRQHFVTLGNFKHAPNVDAVHYLKKEIWPAIRKQLPKSELHIYGAYANQAIMQLHDPDNGFLLKGWVEDKSDVLKNAKVCLAPLRFGAGLKGKLLDAASLGVPAITSQSGNEGLFEMHSEATTTSEFVQKAIDLYIHEALWEKQQTHAFSILKKFNKQLFQDPFFDVLESLGNQLEKHRNQHFIGQILQHQSHYASKYLSKWIEEKNKKQS